MTYFKTLIVLTVFFGNTALASSFTGPMHAVCPEQWSLAKAVITLTDESLNPWSASIDDKAQSKNHLSKSNVIPTIDRVPVTDQDLVDDLLTVASECLVYRNLELDDAVFGRPPSREAITDLGWMPPVIF